MKKLPFNSGQALLLVLLSMSVVLVIAVSIVSRSITDISSTTSDANALEAYILAEADIERALVGLSGAVTVPFGEGQTEINYPIKLYSEDTAILWLTNHDSNGLLGDSAYPDAGFTVCWGVEGALAPAVSVSVFYNDGLVKIARANFDPNPARSALNFFGPAEGSCDVGGVSYPYSGFVPIPSGVPIFAQVRLLYNTDLAEPVAFKSITSPFPAQGKLITATGTSGEANRKIEVFQSFAELPSIFSTNLFSANLIDQSQETP